MNEDKAKKQLDTSVAVLKNALPNDDYRELLDCILDMAYHMGGYDAVSNVAKFDRRATDKQEAAV